MSGKEYISTQAFRLFPLHCQPTKTPHPLHPNHSPLSRAASMAACQRLINVDETCSTLLLSAQTHPQQHSRAGPEPPSTAVKFKYSPSDNSSSSSASLARTSTGSGTGSRSAIPPLEPDLSFRFLSLSPSFGAGIFPKSPKIQSQSD